MTKTYLASVYKGLKNNLNVVSHTCAACKPHTCAACETHPKSQG